MEINCLLERIEEEQMVCWIEQKKYMCLEIVEGKNTRVTVNRNQK
jgi:hypothetical protein